MANNLILRRVVATPEFRPLSATTLIGTVDISTPPFNSGPVFLKGDDGGEVEMVPGEAHQLVRVDLRDIWVRGDEKGQVVTVIGGSW